MKLYPIIYELAKTSRQAEQAGLGLYVSKTNEELIYLLFSPKRCKEVTESYLKRYKGTLGKVKKTVD